MVREHPSPKPGNSLAPEDPEAGVSAEPSHWEGPACADVGWTGGEFRGLTVHEVQGAETRSRGSQPCQEMAVISLGVMLSCHLLPWKGMVTALPGMDHTPVFGLGLAPSSPGQRCYHQQPPGCLCVFLPPTPMRGRLRGPGGPRAPLKPSRPLSGGLWEDECPEAAWEPRHPGCDRRWLPVPTPWFVEGAWALAGLLRPGQ